VCLQRIVFGVIAIKYSSVNLLWPQASAREGGKMIIVGETQKNNLQCWKQKERY
jgi:hypothetical protein